MKLRWIKKYYRKSDGFDGGSTFQSYDRILQYFDEGKWIDVPEVDDEKSRKESEYESYRI